jgi:GNAT superfamily N-acetyltransferase
MTQVDITELTSAEALSLESMTFPAYRHLLALDVSVRHPGQGEQRPIQPIVLGAASGGEMVGMLVAEVPLVPGTGAPELLSVFVRPDKRKIGIGTALIVSAEAVLKQRGLPRVEAVYMTGKPIIAVIEKMLAGCGWEEPRTRAITVRFTPEEAARTPWFGRVRLPERDFELFSWVDLKPEERAFLRESHESSPWIEAGLEPWVHDAYGFDPISSVGLRYRGVVVGWVINHQIAPDTVRFTCSFMRRDLSRRGRILPLYTESIRRLAAAGCQVGTLVTPLNYAAMAEFLRVRCAQAVHFFGETRGTAKSLV